MHPIFALLILVTAQGCAALPESEIERREYNAQIDLQNWTLCEAIYKSLGVATLHDGHSHDRRLGGNSFMWAVRQDLVTMKCKQVIRCDDWSCYWGDRISKEDWERMEEYDSEDH